MTPGQGRYPLSHLTSNHVIRAPLWIPLPYLQQLAVGLALGLFYCCPKGCLGTSVFYQQLSLSGYRIFRMVTPPVKPGPLVARSYAYSYRSLAISGANQ